jgi:hypothetical protein
LRSSIPKFNEAAFQERFVKKRFLRGKTQISVCFGNHFSKHDKSEKTQNPLRRRELVHQSVKYPFIFNSLSESLSRKTVVSGQWSAIRVF